MTSQSAYPQVATLSSLDAVGYVAQYAVSWRRHSLSKPGSRDTTLFVLRNHSALKPSGPIFLKRLSTPPLRELNAGVLGHAPYRRGTDEAGFSITRHYSTLGEKLDIRFEVADFFALDGVQFDLIYDYTLVSCGFPVLILILTLIGLLVSLSRFHHPVGLIGAVKWPNWSGLVAFSSHLSSPLTPTAAPDPPSMCARNIMRRFLETGGR